MLLCDIGNTSYHFLDADEDYKEDVKTFNPASIKENVYYICVEPNTKKSLLKFSNWIDLSEKINMSNYYNTMGIDRIVACEAVQNGVIIDAGSAITVDVVKDGVFQGGFIYPGCRAMSFTYKNISSALDYEFNYDLDTKKLPKNSQDAISYGYLKLLYSEVISYKMPIILTGGDANLLKKIFVDAKVNDRLIFEGMKKLI
ncbi:type III pantothenate kinase [Sulfurimonas lithotrophica]|uniref:Type III pantothenate kinase n=1 Tax=Sulfurimonas lithotrophica TaxID=2590022 RepID=A0A5P8P0J9_9BACT|nr:type III pantothenate kinase [Sulfurimonas lithotrophica]QFR49131.1 type III pantothenate kinase [Sulfurimonas lithotrophica]